MNTTASEMTAVQIRRRANDYDSQIRQGLEDGDVRQVVKRLGNNLVSWLDIALSNILTAYLDRSSDPPDKGHQGTSGGFSKATVPLQVHPGMEQLVKRPGFC